MRDISQSVPCHLVEEQRRQLRQLRHQLLLSLSAGRTPHSLSLYHCVTCSLQLWSSATCYSTKMHATCLMSLVLLSSLPETLNQVVNIDVAGGTTQPYDQETVTSPSDNSPTYLVTVKPPPKVPIPIDFPSDHLYLPDVLRDLGEPLDSIIGYLKKLLLSFDYLLFPGSWNKLDEPLQSLVNVFLRAPVSIIAWIIGEKVELLGHQALQLGNALLAFGPRDIGLTLKDYGIGFMAFGKTVKDWFVYHHVPQRLVNLTNHRNDSHEAAYGLWWNELGIQYVHNRVDLEHLYSIQN